MYWGKLSFSFFFLFSFIDRRRTIKKNDNVFLVDFCMLRALRIIQTKVRFIPAPRFFNMQSTTETTTRPASGKPASARPASSTTKSYAPQDLPVYDYDLVVVGGGSGGKKKTEMNINKIF